MDRDKLLSGIDLACGWLSDIAQVKTQHLTCESNSQGFNYSSWKGAIRGEYSAADRQWDFFCPVWHTGQAVKALLLACKVLESEKYLESAKLGAEFILDKQIWDKSHPDHGLILAFEDIPDKVNTSAVLECLDGLIFLAGEGREEIWERIIGCADFLIERLYMEEEGLFRDVYDPARHSPLLPNPYLSKDGKGGRPLLDDGIMARIYEKTGEKRFLDVHLRISETLVKDQNPPGNWIDYGPCIASLSLFHPRHTYWWGLPLIHTYRLTKREEFLQTAISSGEFCKQAMRKDGGWIRGTYLSPDGGLTTDSFGHSTSGSACAAILFLELYGETGGVEWLKEAEKALLFCQEVQFVNPGDPSLKGAVLEKVLPPAGTDESPYHIRDLGTIFFVQGAAKILDCGSGRFESF